MRIRTVTTEAWVPRPIDEVFAFFADVRNLDPLTPPWLHFRILTVTPIEVHRGTLIDYTIRWRWVPLRWQTEITAWEPPYRFVDTQRRGPYRQWIHEHTFAERDGGTLLIDRVEYAVPGGFLEPALHAWLVGPDVERIFAFRKKTLLARFGQSAS